MLKNLGSFCKVTLKFFYAVVGFFVCKHHSTMRKFSCKPFALGACNIIDGKNTHVTSKKC